MTESARDGVRGYSAQSEELVLHLEAVPFDEVHAGMLDLVPPSPCSILDIGAGTGRDAAWFARRGYDVTALEPTDLREKGKVLHARDNIVWIDDALPGLRSIAGRTFDLVWMSAVWMHFTTEERVAMMPTVADLVGPTGAMMISLRHGPMPDGRRMFEVSAAETIAHGANAGLHCIRQVEMDSTWKPGVQWSRLWFSRTAT